MSEIIFIDVEASGLHASSYPIEIGWCGLDLGADGFLIKPAPHWSEWDWSLESQKIHGIQRGDCLKLGLDVWDATRRLNEVVGDRVVFSDAPGFDGAWVARLFDACGVEPEFPLRPLDALAEIIKELSPRGMDLRDLEQRVRAKVARPHRAAADARYLAALWRSAFEDGFLDSLEGDAPL